MKAKEQMFTFTERFRWFPHLWKSQIQPPDHSCAESKAKSGCSTPCSSDLWATPRLELAQPPRCCGTLRDSILFLNTRREKAHGKKKTQREDLVVILIKYPQAQELKHALRMGRLTGHWVQSAEKDWKARSCEPDLCPPEGLKRRSAYRYSADASRLL